MKTTRKRKKYEYQIVAFDLQGNETDGFDNNGGVTIHRFGATRRISDTSMNLEVKEWFTGRSYALDQDQSIGMCRSELSWSWSDENYADILFRGTPVGAIFITEGED